MVVDDWLRQDDDSTHHALPTGPTLSSKVLTITPNPTHQRKPKRNVPNSFYSFPRVKTFQEFSYGCTLYHDMFMFIIKQGQRIETF